MKGTINFNDQELAPALQKHLDTGLSVQEYIRAAVKHFNTSPDYTQERAIKSIVEKLDDNDIPF